MSNWASTTNWLSDSSRAPNSESDLVRAAQLGDKSAFQQLILRYDRLVLTFALNVTQSEDDARGIYEQVFLRAFKRMSATSFQSSLFVWIYRIAADCCQQFLVEESKRKRLLDRSSRAHRDDSASSAAARLSQLSVRERLVFVLAHHGHLRAATIAEIVSIPEISVKEALIRAVYKLSAAANVRGASTREAGSQASSLAG